MAPHHLLHRSSAVWRRLVGLALRLRHGCRAGLPCAVHAICFAAHNVGQSWTDIRICGCGTLTYESQSHRTHTDYLNNKSRQPRRCHLNIFIRAGINTSQCRRKRSGSRWHVTCEQLSERRFIVGCDKHERYISVCWK